MIHMRPSIHHPNTESNEQQISDNYSTSSSKKPTSPNPVVIFGYFDLSFLSATWQYIILSLGLFICMCIYGYCQELVAYGFFERKLSIFSTFSHFLGCFLIAMFQRLHLQSISSSKTTSSEGIIHKSKLSLGMMGMASYSISLRYYFLLIFLKTMSQGLTNYSMTLINYPAKVLFKSANPIITMLIGLVWFRRKYPYRDYIVVFLLVIGLYVFVIYGDSSTSGSPEGTSFGVLLVAVAMFCGAAVPMVQEHCINTYGATVEELLYHSFLGSTIVSFVLSITSGELFQGTHFIIVRGNVNIWTALIVFCLFGFAGANFSSGLTLRFGSLVNGITNTARKAVTLVLSFALFPSRNHLTIYHVIGALIFFCGLVIRTLSKDEKEISSEEDESSDSMKTMLGSPKRRETNGHHV